MLEKLFRLCRRDTPLGKTPLEDFTTEAFVGAMNVNDKFKNLFIHNLLGLPDGKYEITTQKQFLLPDGKNCKIDVVLERDDEKVICFIENKVNSTEGKSQLSKYSKVLDLKAKTDVDTYLFYCTKNYDSKSIDKHHFKCIRWYQIASKLELLKQDFLSNDFYNFLKQHKMAERQILSQLDISTMQNMASTVSLMTEYMDNVKPAFDKMFKNSNKKGLIRQLNNWNRWIYSTEGIVEGIDSDFNFGFYFDGPVKRVGMYIEQSDKPFYENIYRQAKTFGKFDYVSNQDKKTVIYLAEPIENLVNKESSKKEIIDWFKNALNVFDEFFKSTDGIPWSIKS